MVGWVWVAAAILAVLAVHALAFRRASRGWRTDADGADPSATEVFHAAHDFEAEPVDDGVLCPACGEYNDEGFTFCRRCTGRLQ